MRIVFLGDSHLARVRRDLHLIGPDVCNAAEGGASASDLQAQAKAAGFAAGDMGVLSVGTNDAALPGQVPLTVFARALLELMSSVPARRWIYLAPPGVDEARLTGPRVRTNADLDAYRDAALRVCDDTGAGVVRADRLIAPLGAAAFAPDGLHLSGPAYQVILRGIADAVRQAA